MNIYLYELKAGRKTTIIWLLAIIAITCLEIGLYPSFEKDIQSFVNIINNFPESIRTIIGMNPSVMKSVLGYYSFLLMYVFVLTSIQSTILGLSILSKEIRDKTADFLFTKPVSRNQIFLSKLLASLTILLISDIVIFLSFYTILAVFSNASFSFSSYTLVTLVIFLIQLIFFGIGFLLSVLIPKIKAVLTLSLGIVFAFYLISAFASDKYRAFLPFKYFDLEKILLNNSYELKYLALSLLIPMVCIVIANIIYKRKDIDAV